MSKKDLTKNLELRKPSELCQVLYYKDFIKEEFAVLTPIQVDLIGTMFFFISDIMLQQELTEEEIYEWASLNHFEINLQSISDVLGKYKNGYYNEIIKNLHEISKIQVLTNVLHKNKTQESILFHFLRKIAWSKDKQTTSKRVKVWIEPELLIMFLNVKNYYTKFSLQIQVGLKSKYSKLLYELLKDYVGSYEKRIEINILKAILNVDIINKPSLQKWANFNRDILKKAVQEVNDKSDIKVTYEVIKDRIDKKLEVVAVKFKLESQKSILIDYTDNVSYDLDTKIISNEELPAIELSPIEMKYRSLAKKRLEQTKIFGTEIKNEEKYLETIIRNLKSENLEIENMIIVDNLFKEIISYIDVPESNKPKVLIMENFEGQPIVSISNQYLLYSPINKSNITETIESTINKINKFKDMGGKFKIIETNEIISEIAYSYL